MAKCPKQKHGYAYGEVSDPELRIGAAYAIICVHCPYRIVVCCPTKREQEFVRRRVKEKGLLPE